MTSYTADSTVEAIAAEAVELRHRIHQAPELSGEESDTALAVSEELRREGYDPQTFPGHQGLVAIWPGLDRSRALGLRADLDALPLQEKSGRPWASRKPGIMHACGHDGHASLLVGMAKWLARRGKPYPCDIALIFQPAEESGQGAPQLIRDGLLSGPPEIEAIFGLHGWPELPLGTVAVHDTAVMASVDNFEIILQGRGAHAAMPHQGIDPVVAAAHLITAAQSLVSRRTPPLASGVVTFGSIEGGKAHNVIPTECRMRGTIRALDPGVRQTLREGLENLVRHLAPALGAQGELIWVESTPATRNHPAMAALVREAVIQALGPQALREIPPSMGGEDFSFFLEKVRGAYFWLGIGDEQGLLHNPRFDFNDLAIAPALRILDALLDRYFAARP